MLALNIDWVDLTSLSSCSLSYLTLVKQPERLSTTDTIGVVIWLLTKANSPLASPLAIVIISSRMIDTAIVPNSYIVRILPPKAYLEIMVLSQQLQKPLPKLSALILSNFVDTLGMVTNSEDAFPASDLR